LVSENEAHYICLYCSAFDLAVGCVGLAVADVVSDALIPKHRLLLDNRNIASEFFQIVLFDVLTVDKDLSSVAVVKP
jgi:hypothetical protein